MMVDTPNFLLLAHHEKLLDHLGFICASLCCINMLASFSLKETSQPVRNKVQMGV